MNNKKKSMNNKYKIWFALAFALLFILGLITSTLFPLIISGIIMVIILFVDLDETPQKAEVEYKPKTLEEFFSNFEPIDDYFEILDVKPGDTGFFMKGLRDNSVDNLSTVLSCKYFSKFSFRIRDEYTVVRVSRDSDLFVERMDSFFLDATSWAAKKRVSGSDSVKISHQITKILPTKVKIGTTFYARDYNNMVHHYVVMGSTMELYLHENGTEIIESSYFNVQKLEENLSSFDIESLHKGEWIRYYCTGMVSETNFDKMFHTEEELYSYEESISNFCKIIVSESEIIPKNTEYYRKLERWNSDQNDSEELEGDFS